MKFKPSSVVIVVVLLTQAALPLRYYLGSSGNDERFCWRMFSTRQLQLKKSSAPILARETTAGRTTFIRLDRDIPAPWVEFLRREHPLVVHHYKQWRKRQSGADRVTLQPSTTR